MNDFKYDESKDKLLDSREILNENRSAGYEVKLVQYDNGDIKVQVDNFFFGQNGEKGYNKSKRIKLSYFYEINKAVVEMENKLNDEQF